MSVVVCVVVSQGKDVAFILVWGHFAPPDVYCISSVFKVHVDGVPWRDSPLFSMN